jgi:hypothetical protein
MIDDKAQNSIMEAYERTILKENKNFAKGKDVEWIAKYLLKIADNWKAQLKTASTTGGYGSTVNNLVDSGLSDLQGLKKQLDQLAKGRDKN